MADRFYSLGTHGILLSVRAKPGARHDAVLGARAGELLVSVRARPEKGRANTEVIRTIAEALGISRTDVVLKRGGGSQHKVFHLPPAALRALEALEARAAHGAPGLKGDLS